MDEIAQDLQVSVEKDNIGVDTGVGGVVAGA